jgi:chromatin segregation and condensation protein Rec8/ScpA/Scc1 (kleisin family)
MMEAMMGVLNKLKIVALAPKVKASAEQDRRTKLVEQLKEQQKLAEAALGGAAYQRTKAVWITDDAGNRSQVQRPVKARQWWTVGATCRSRSLMVTRRCSGSSVGALRR